MEVTEVVGVAKKVIVMPYDESWKLAFEEIKKEIVSALGDLILWLVN